MLFMLLDVWRQTIVIAVVIRGRHENIMGIPGSRSNRET
jgi:hypothetical protein